MAVGIEAIDRLKLDEAFAKGTFRPFNECWTVRMDRELLIVDDDTEKYSRFSDDPEEESKALMVINEKNKQIVLLSIDNKLISSHQGGITDCALFDTDQFRFIEFKTNAYGNSEKAVHETFEKASHQLIETIHVFADRLEKVNVTFEDAITISCHIVVSHSFPKSKAMKQEFQLAFAEETGYALDFSEKTYWEKK